jgi:diguanylate cyclase (GGDEF)-like protein/PAS domain S-box-containing protein
VAQPTAEKAPRARLLRLQAAALAAAVNSIYITTVDGRIVWVNAAFTRLSGYTAAEAVGQTPRLLKSGQQDTGFYRELWATILAGRAWRGEVVERHKHGSLYTVAQTITPLLNVRGRVTHFVAIHEDVTAQKSAEELIRHQALYDALTDLPNRILFCDRLAQALAQARRRGELVAVIFLDLDDFKATNDSFGHLMGDRLLQLVADRLRSRVRDGDTVARLSGDEFALVLGGLGAAQGAARVAESLVQTLAQPFQLGEHIGQAHASVGVSLYPSDGSDADTLLHHADTAMYRAKRRGGNGYQFYDPSSLTIASPDSSRPGATPRDA